MLRFTFSFRLKKFKIQFKTEVFKINSVTTGSKFNKYNKFANNTYNFSLITRANR